MERAGGEDQPGSRGVFRWELLAVLMASLLLFLGVMVPMVLYTLWGVIDILTLPVAK